MSDTQIDSLSLEITSSANEACNGLDALTKSLKKLQTATSKGLGLTAISNDLKNANFDGGAQKIQSLVDALKPLEAIGKTRFTSIATAFKKLPDAINAIDTRALYTKVQSLTRIFAPLAEEMDKVARGFSALPTKIQRLIKETDKIPKSNNKASLSYVNLYAKLQMMKTAVMGIARRIASWINESSEYTETLNLFTVAMGDYAQKAYDYGQTVERVMGIDPAEWMHSQSIFMTLAEGFGVAGDRAYTMSQQLTQLGYDLSSFYNIGVEDAMLKLQSGIAGELEPLRRLGYDLSNAKLEATALSLGIDKAVSSMTQAEKAELRYYAIMTQVTKAQGDMARTLDAPANQMRILNAQVTQLGRALGNFFIPLLNKVLPYIIASVKVLREVLDVFMNLLGIELAEVEFGDGSITSATEDIVENLEDGQKEAKKLKSYMLGFDELNVLNADDGSELEDLLGTGFSFDLPTYDFMDGIVSTQIDGIVQKMKDWLGITEDIDSWADLLDTKFGDILTTVGLIGLGIAAWKVTKGFIDAISMLKFLLSSPTYTIAIGVVLTLTGFSIEFNGLKDAVKNGLDGFNFAEIVGGALLGTGGSAILGSKIATWIATTFTGTKVATALSTAASNLGLATAGAAGAAIAAGIAGIVAGIPMYFVGIYDACMEGIDWLSSLLIGAGATAAGAGIGAIIGAIGGPIGAGIGALVGLAIGLITDFTIWFWQKFDEIEVWFNGLPGWAKVLVGAISGLTGGIYTIIASVITAIKKWDVIVEWVKNACSAIGQFFVDLWNRIKAIFAPIVEWFSKLFGSVKQTISDVFYNIGVIVKGCWTIIKTAWNGASNWFNEKFITPVKTKFNSLWSGFKEKAKAAWDGVKSVFGGVATFFGDKFKDAWEKVKKVFSVGGKIFEGIKDGIVDAFKTIVNTLIKGINKVVSVPFNAINTALKKIKDISILGIEPFKDLKTISIPQIPLLAEGGMVNTGQLFVAREAGAELVGNIGGRTAVMNNDQIVESVSAGVYQAVLAALGGNNDDGADTNIIITLDGEKIYENQQKIARGRGYNLGMGAFSFG